ncbi:hypothetical protein [Candidatus Poriferisodalis sp.]|uniref:hypothetical protein n=1 Tax=Candidatus Poriferisodalis sp. TaxID=3101277 RepID=UPI003C6FAC20
MSAVREPSDKGKAIEQSHLPSAFCYGLLTEAEVDNLNEIISYEVSQGTIRIYECQWRQFVAWGVLRGVTVLPAAPAHVAAYLADRVEKLGHKPATLRVAAAAIAFVHATLELQSPCAHPDVKRTLKGATRKAGRAQKQARGLTAEMLDAIRATARHPRIGRGGRPESLQTAERRGVQDIAMAGLMRDAMLRVSEAAALKWNDIETAPDGSGRLLIRRSKTDPEGEGAVVFVSIQTMVDLEPIRNGPGGDLNVFGLHRNQISLRIQKAAAAAGLGGWSAIGVWCVLFVERARLSGRWFGVGWARVFCLMMPRRIVGRPVGAGVAGRGGCFT